MDFNSVFMSVIVDTVAIFRVRPQLSSRETGITAGKKFFVVLLRESGFNSSVCAGDMLYAVRLEE